MKQSSHLRLWVVTILTTIGFGVLIFFAMSRPHVQGMQYDQFLAVLLTALGVILAALALFVGLAAVFGYQFIRDEAEKKAVEAARQTARKVARTTATRIANKVLSGVPMQAQASGLSESQAEDAATEGKSKAKTRSGSTRATSDKGLNRNGG